MAKVQNGWFRCDAPKTNTYLWLECVFKTMLFTLDFSTHPSYFPIYSSPIRFLPTWKKMGDYCYKKIRKHMAPSPSEWDKISVWKHSQRWDDTWSPRKSCSYKWLREWHANLVSDVTKWITPCKWKCYGHTIFLSFLCYSCSLSQLSRSLSTL